MFSLDSLGPIININDPLEGTFLIYGDYTLGSELSLDLTNLIDNDGIDYDKFNIVGIGQMKKVIFHFKLMIILLMEIGYFLQIKTNIH